ncbi:MAG: VCBS repeat-containing protein [Xanthomonadales bacterium]|nr:VCBS repeat-containing protein [Xanthomonadales bacterium]
MQSFERGGSLLALLALVSLANPVDGFDVVRQSIVVGEGQKEAVAGDIDGDGRAELVVAGNGQLAIAKWQDGRLVVETRFAAGPDPTGPALGDIDGDGRVDIAVANHDTRLVSLFRGDGSGGFDPFPGSPLTIDVDPHPHAVLLADLDADGDLDLVVDHRNRGGLLVLRNRGDGTFQQPGVFVDGGGDPYRGMVVGDLNGDGLLDLVTPNPRSVGVMLATDPERLTFSRDEITTAAGPFSVALADLNGDGALDIIAALDEGSRQIQVLIGDGQGRFQEAVGSPFDLASGGKMIAVGDFNGDRIDDAATVGWSAPHALVLVGDHRSLRTVQLEAGENAWGPAAGDFNGDGIDDLAIPDAAGSEAMIHLSSGPAHSPQ